MSNTYTARLALYAPSTAAGYFMEDSKQYSKFMTSHSRESENIIHWTNVGAVEVIGGHKGLSSTGVLIATDQRIVFFKKKLTAEYLKEIKLDNITSVNVKAVKSQLALSIFQKDEELVVVPMERNTADKLVSVLSEYTEFETKEVPAHNNHDNAGSLAAGIAIVFALSAWMLWPSKSNPEFTKPSPYASVPDQTFQLCVTRGHQVMDDMRTHGNSSSQHTASYEKWHRWCSLGKLTSGSGGIPKSIPVTPEAWELHYKEFISEASL